MITNHVTEAGGFEVLDRKILKFRSASFRSAKTMFEEFVVWYFQEGTKKEGLEFIVNAIQNAALFIGLHCLKFFAEDAEDDETCEAILDNGKDIVRFFMEGDFTFSEVPPPRFDPRKIVDFIDCDDESVFRAIDSISEDGDFGGMMMEFLRMSGGGRNEVSCDSGKKELSEQEKIRAVFEQWDIDGSGKISKEEVMRRFMVSDPDLTENDISDMFAAADQNGDDTYNEFVDWLMLTNDEVLDRMHEQ